MPDNGKEPADELEIRTSGPASDPRHAVVKLGGYDGRYGLKCWWVAGVVAPHESCCDDIAALKASAEGLIATGDYARIELSAWNFELNDWVRIETFEPDRESGGRRKPFS